MSLCLKWFLYVVGGLCGLIITGLVLIAVLILCSCNAHAEDITLADTLWLRKATHINYDVDAWDTMFVDIMRGSVQVERVFLSSNGKGRWNGFYVPSYDGNFVAEYNAVYSGDTTVEETYFTVFDTVAFHGAAAGLTAEGIWEHDLAGEHFDGDSTQAGDYMRIAAACGSGTGSDTLDIIVFDADTTAVEGVDICIYNPTKTAYAIPNVDTDVNGYCQVFLDPASYPVWCQRLGIIQAEWDTIIVPSGGGRDTIWVVAQPAGSPPSANVTRLIGYNRDLGYEKKYRIAIHMRPQHANLLDTCEDVFVSTGERIAYSDTGYFQIDVIPSKCLLSKDETDIDSVLYDVFIYRKSIKEGEYRNIFVPDSSGNVRLKDLLD